VESKSRQTSEQYHYQQHSQPEAPIAKVDEQTVPVLLCHTCSICSRMRSAGYHRHHPVVPGKPLVLTPCRRCKKKMKYQGRSMNSFMRVRSCTANEPCDWPREHVRVDVNHEGLRGRTRNREEAYLYEQLPDRTHTIRRSSSKARLGLRVLQQDQDIPHVIRRETKVRVSSLSPRRASGYEELWPVPDVVRMRPARLDEIQSKARTNPNLVSHGEVHPPPDVVRTHFYRKSTEIPTRRESSRVVELSPSPPSMRRHSTRIVYRNESAERRPRSVSPARVRFQEQRSSEEAEARMMSHPRPYRTVLPEHHNFNKTPSDEASSNNEYVLHGRQVSPARGILKPAGGEREILHPQASMHEGQQIDTAEIRGPRVRFRSREEDDQAAPANRDKPRYADDTRQLDEAYEHYHDYSRHRYVDVPSRSPVEEMRRLRVRPLSPPPQRHYEEETRNDGARRASPTPRGIRHVSPLRERERTRPPRSPPPPLPRERSGYVNYHHISNTRAHPRTQSSTPPAVLQSASEDLTDSDSAHSAEITEVKKWRGIDENGQPVTFVEERKTKKLLEQGSERGGLADFRPMKERLVTRGWRDM
jgi:hypothetical protein